MQKSCGSFNRAFDGIQVLDAFGAAELNPVLVAPASAAVAPPAIEGAGGMSSKTLFDVLLSVAPPRLQS